MVLLFALVASAQEVIVVDPPHPVLTWNNNVLWLKWSGYPNIRYYVSINEALNEPWMPWCSRSSTATTTFQTAVPYSPLVVNQMQFRIDLLPPSDRPSARIAQALPLSLCLVDYSIHDYGYLHSILSCDIPKYTSSCIETQYFRGHIYITNSDCAYLYVRSDDGSSVMLQGVTTVNHFGQNQSWSDISKSFAFAGKLSPGDNLVLVSYANTVHTANDHDDGVSLFMVGSGSPLKNHIVDGTNVIRWLGDTNTSSYVLTRSASHITWSCSSNLLLCSTDDNFQEANVRPVRHSDHPNDDWIEATYFNPCSSLFETSRCYVTILRPRDCEIITNQAGFMTYAGKSWFAVSNYVQILDQFDSPWTNDCNVSSDSAVTAPDPLPSSVSLMPDLSSVNAPQGKFTDMLGIIIGLDTSTIDVYQNRALRAHQNGNFGLTIGLWKIKYHREYLTDSDFIVVKTP